LPAYAQGQPSAQSSQQLPPEFAQDQIPSAFPSMNDQDQNATQARPSTQIIPEAATDAAAAPAERKLVPATAMGTKAEAGESEEQESAPAMPDILEKYTAQTEELNDNTPTDALPPSTNLSRVKLQGEGFELGNRTSTVEIDGSLVEQGNNAALQEEIRTEAFDAAITGMFPLTPEQIKGLLKQYDKTQEAAKTPPYTAPKPEISVQNISLDPGVAPVTIKTAIGNVTTINMLDATGAPWPVQDVTWAGDYEIVEPEEGGHIIRITPMSHYARGNIVIRMLTLKTPLTLTLETGRDVVQYRVDARIPEYGPFASAPLMQGGTSLVAGTPELTAILDGVAPGGAIRLDVAGVDGRTTAYTIGGTTYVRTPLTLLSPAWQSSVSSADGMNVYALSNAPVLLLSDGGEFMRAVLKEKEDLLDD